MVRRKVGKGKGKMVGGLAQGGKRSPEGPQGMTKVDRRPRSTLSSYRNCLPSSLKRRSLACPAKLSKSWRTW